MDAESLDAAGPDDPPTLEPAASLDPAAESVVDRSTEDPASPAAAALASTIGELLSTPIESVPIDSVHPDPQNAMNHPERNIADVRRSLQRFGQVEPLLVWRGMIIHGSGRHEVMRADGWRECEIRRCDHLSESAAKALAIAMNRTAQSAEWNVEQLDATLKLLASDGWDVADVGFDRSEIDKLLAGWSAAHVPLEGLTDPDAIPEPPDEPITRPGDLWILGDHRLLCGDSSKPEDVDRLLDGAPIHLVNTDPPYNVKVEPRSNNAIAAGNSSFSNKHHQKFDLERHPEKSKPTHAKMRAKDRPLENDFVTDEEFDRLLDAWFGNAARVLLPGRGFYIWGGYANLGNYPPFLKKHDLYFSQGIVWDKQHPVLTRKDFMGAFEIAFYGWRKGAAHVFLGPNNATDLWHVKKVNPQSMVHLTEKPVELAVRAIQFSSRPGENVLDLFGGSGSTLIGCQQTGRHAFLIELDPAYCDVIVQRWETFTGQAAIRSPAA